MTKLYHLHVDLSPEYAPLRTRNSKQPKLSTSDMVRYREEKLKHVDLWSSGTLYPIDPCSLQHPDFHSVSQLIIYMCHGKNGLLGYCENLMLYGNAHSMQRIHYLEEESRKISKECEEKSTKLKTCLDENEMLKKEIQRLKSSLHHYTTSNDEIKIAFQSMRISYLSLVKDMDVLNRKVRSNKRKRLVNKDICDLSSRGGHRKRRIRAFK